jgi:histidinol-phosphate aminotransferase
MSRFWSDVVKGLTPYVPGEQPKLANLVKLNTNENPYGPSPRALEAIRAATGDTLKLYPDPNADRLKRAIAPPTASKPAMSSSATARTKSWPTPSSACSSTARPILFPGHHLQLLPGVLRALPGRL